MRPQLDVALLVSFRHMTADVRPSPATALWAVLAIAVARLLIHLYYGDDYGFHRDELATLTDSQRLAWGYVAYPPVTPLLGRIGLELFGVTPLAVRWIAALAQAGIVILTALMARDLGGSRAAQVVAAAAVAVAPVSILHGVLFQYVTFDMFWWVLLGWLAIRLVRSNDPRWWLAIGAVIGAGMMTKYTMIFLVAGIVAGVLCTRVRRQLRSPWLWAGVALSLVIFLPNFLWQIRHEFISLDFLQHIHERDVRIGRTAGYFNGQLTTGANPLTIPIWIAGLWFLTLSRRGAQYRILAFLWVVPFLLFALAEGRAYYMAGAYPLLLAAGSVAWGLLYASRIGWQRHLLATITTIALLIGAAGAGYVLLPLDAVNSAQWHASADAHDNFVEQIGWDDLVDTVARVYESLPEEERRHTGILTGNYGEAGAIQLLGREHGLPEPISGINSFWLRGYGNAPSTVILLGRDMEDATRIFEQCTVAEQITNRFGVENEESRDHPDVILCRTPRAPWPEIWPHLRSFG